MKYLSLMTTPETKKAKNNLHDAHVRVVNQQVDLATICLTGPLVSVDLETSGLNWWEDDILLISLATSFDEAFVLDATTLPTQVVAGWLCNQLQGKLVVGHNLAFDLKFLAYHYGFDLNASTYYDTMLAEIISFAGFDLSNSLQETAKRWLKIDLDKTIRADFTKYGLSLSLTEQHYRYAALDAVVTLAVRAEQLRHLKQYELERIAELEMRLLPVVVGMELRGVPFDPAKFASFVQSVQDRRTRYEQWMQEALRPAAEYFAGVAAKEKGMLFPVVSEININSKPAQKDGVWNYGQFWPALKWFGIEITDKEGNPSLSSKDMQRWDVAHTVAVAIPEDARNWLHAHRLYRNDLLNLYAHTISLQKLDDSFIKTIREMERNGRLYPWFKQLGAKNTGRFSSNLQQLPKDDKITPFGVPSLRQCIGNKPGKKLIIADFAGIELVILADMSGDELLGDLIVRSARGEEDIHLYVVRQAFVDLYPEARNATLDKKKVAPYKQLRDAAKPTSYGIAYGITGMALSETISQLLAPLGVTCTPEQAQQIIDNWKTKAFAKAGAWLDKTSKSGQTLGYVQTALGRKRFFDIRNADRKALSAIGREASNAPIQGTCADMLKLAMIYVDRDLDPHKASVILTVHDELVLESDEDYAETAAVILKNAMEKAAQKCMPRMGKYVVVEPAISDCYDK